MLKEIALILLLTGCSSTSNLVGQWQGKTGPFNTAFKFDSTGKGTLCYSGRKVNRLEWAKYDNGIIHTEKGGDLFVRSLSGDKLIIEADRYGSIKYTFTRSVKKASWFCRNKLK